MAMHRRFLQRLQDLGKIICSRNTVSKDLSLQADQFISGRARPMWSKLAFRSPLIILRFYSVLYSLRGQCQGVSLSPFMDMLLVKAAYEREGYVIVPGLVPPSDATIHGLFDAAGAAATLTHAGIWPHRRTVGKQFPPYDDANPDSWGVQHLLHPDLPVGNRAVFMQWYVSDALIGVVKTLLECKEEDLQMELFNMLINPKSHDFALRWHRDDIKESATEDEERHALSIPHYGVQWNTALYDDSCLYVVPKSHNHPRTDEQRKHSNTPHPPSDPLDMPGAIQVHLKEGETVFYNSNILHCATYSSSSRRMTLHGCIGDARGGSKRARNVLQHGLEWMREDKFLNTLPEGRAQNMWKRLMEMERGTSGGRQYSLEG